MAMEQNDPENVIFTNQQVGDSENNELVEPLDVAPKQTLSRRIFDESEFENDIAGTSDEQSMKPTRLFPDIPTGPCYTIILSLFNTTYPFQLK